MSWEETYHLKVIEPEKIKEKVAQLRKRGNTIVTLNGSFDLLHAGHLQILFEAKKQGDILIVALNTDDSIKAYKSPSRPVIPLLERIQMMAAIEFVDYVTYFNETDPRAFLEMVGPDVHVNGNEYGENCIEAQTVVQKGGKIHIAKLKPGLSTSKIMQKIKQCD